MGEQSFIADLSPDALIASWVINGAMDGEAFAAYIQQVPVPERQPGKVVILDNLAIDKNAAAVRAMREAGCWFQFLPAHGPDQNPCMEGSWVARVL
ncbi:MAG: transposase [Pseudomonadota bacterium]